MMRGSECERVTGRTSWLTESTAGGKKKTERVAWELVAGVCLALVLFLSPTPVFS